MPKEVKLKSGHVLTVHLAPFADSKALYQAVMEEVKRIPFTSTDQVVELAKNLLCTGLASPAIEEKLWACMSRCTYNFGQGNMKITEDLFEDAKRREDYWPICAEVAMENILPFAKSLFAQFGPVFRKVKEELSSKLVTTPS